MSTTPKDHALEFLNHYVGTWVNQMADFPTKVDPTAKREVVVERTDWELDRSFILARTLNLNSGLKSLWAITLDPKDEKLYNWWYVDNSGWFDYWNFRRYDDAVMVVAENAKETADVDLASRWAGETQSAEAFDADGNYYGMLEAYDEQGNKSLHLVGQKSRQPEMACDSMLQPWHTFGMPQAPVPQEITRFDTLAGTWDAAVTDPTVKAASSPVSGKVLSARLLDGWALELRVEVGETRALCLLAYDSLIEKYRLYVFSDRNVHLQLFGEFEGDKNTLVMKDLAKRTGDASALSVTFVDQDTIKADIQIGPVDGKMTQFRVTLTRTA